MDINAIIIDDEDAARNILKRLISENFPSVNIIGEAANVKDAVKLINKMNVELVILDIEMPNESGLALFDYFENPKFETIFCTAYSQYAIQAFDVSAIDYVLKPVSITKLKLAIEKAIKMHGQNSVLNRINALRENIYESRMQKIALPLSDGIIFVKINEILYFEAEGSYTHVHTIAKKILVSKKLKHFEDLFESDNRFFRTHRSFLINADNVYKYSKKDGASLIFENGIEIPIAREKVKDFDNFLNEKK